MAIRPPASSDAATLIEGDIPVRRMSHDQKVRLANEIYAQQPNMLASILALPRMGVDMGQLEVALHILLVTFQAMKCCAGAGAGAGADDQYQVAVR